MYQRLLLVCAVGVGCSSSDRRAPAVAPLVPTTPAKTEATKNCADTVALFEDGKERDAVCADALPANAVMLDLRDAWAPILFAIQPDGTAPDFRANYLAAALEQDLDGKRLPPSLGLTELYGVLPSLAIVRDRMTHTDRYDCHAKVDSGPMKGITRPYGQELAGSIQFNNRQRTYLGKNLERVRAQKNLPDLAALATDRELGPTYARYKTTDDLYQGIVSAQRHLACDGLLTEKQVDGEFSWAFGQALEHFQRRHFLIPNGRIDPETRAALATDPKELDFRFALRVLRERVVDATGLIEDGTAGKGPEAILGRRLDPDAMESVHGWTKPALNAAPDLVSPATEAAAKALGWTDPDAAAAWLAKYPTGMRVAVVLPPPPAYYSKHMDLSAEIDRGDVWYDETPVPRVAWKRPALILYVQDGATKRALVRWPTTIGGWSNVRIGGSIVKRWKESDVGPRVWRQIFAAPTWLPPGTTPDTELVKYAGKGKPWELKKSIMGPGPMAAFGMMLMPNSRVVGKGKYAENGIGTHGSAVVTSILNGTSHGCHRLYNHEAIRLGSFLLHHRDHEVKGQQPEHYRRTIHAMGKTYYAKIDTRGFLYELTPPVPVNVLPGNIRSARKTPPANSVAAGAE
jgi:hypothetical protein